MPMVVFRAMDDGPRYFTVEEANDLVGALQLEFGRVAQLRSELQPLVQSMGGAEVAVGILQDGRAAQPGREADAARLQRLAAEVAAAVERVNAMGCLVKDLEQGLVDFYSMRDDESVFLCWQFGEPAVAHWHPVDAGFAARQPIEGVTVRPPPFVN
jgi:hypothetical protein